MDNEKALKKGIELLSTVDIEKVESVQISTTTFDDGSKSIEVSVSFPAKEVTESK